MRRHRRKARYEAGVREAAAVSKAAAAAVSRSLELTETLVYADFLLRASEIASHRIAAPFVRCQYRKDEDELGEKDSTFNVITPSL